MSIFDINLQKLQWTYCPEHARVKGNDQADRLVGNATIASGFHLGRSEVLKHLEHYQGHHTIGHLEERDVEMTFLERMRAGHLQSPKATLGKLSKHTETESN